MDNTKKAENMLKTSEAIVTILQTDEGINNYLKKADLKIGDKQLEIINKVLEILSVNTSDNEQSPLNELLDTLAEVMEDGKLKLNEMIKLVNVLVKNVKNIDVDSIEFGNEDFATLLKLLIIILDETKVIDIDNDQELIFNSIDSCVFLIEQMGEVKIEIGSDKDSEKNNEKDSDDDDTNVSLDKQNNTENNNLTVDTSDPDDTNDTNDQVDNSNNNSPDDNKDTTASASPVAPVVDEKASCKCLWFKFSF